VGDAQGFDHAGLGSVRQADSGRQGFILSTRV
jgi:hypothetical protein